MSDRNRWGAEEDEVLTHYNPDEWCEGEIFEDETRETITLFEYERETIWEDSVTADIVLDHILERLDEEYGGDDSTDPSEKMKEAALAFAKVIREEYMPWVMKKTGKSVEINVKEWLAENPQ